MLILIIYTFQKLVATARENDFGSLKKIFGVFSKRGLLVTASIFSAVARLTYPLFKEHCNTLKDFDVLDLGAIDSASSKWLLNDKIFLFSATPSKSIFRSEEAFQAALFNFDCSKDEILQFRHYCQSLMVCKSWESYYQNAVQSTFFPSLGEGTGWWGLSASLFANKPAQKTDTTITHEREQLRSNLKSDEYVMHLVKELGSKKKLHLLHMLGQPLKGGQFHLRPVDEAVSLAPAYLGGTFPPLLFDLIYKDTLPLLEIGFYYGEAVVRTYKFATVNEMLGFQVKKWDKKDGKITFTDPELLPDFARFNFQHRLLSGKTFGKKTELTIKLADQSSVMLLFTDFIRGEQNSQFLRTFICAMAIRLQPAPVEGAPAGRWNCNPEDDSIYGVSWKGDNLILSKEKNRESAFISKFQKVKQAFPKDADFEETFNAKVEDASAKEKKEKEELSAPLKQLEVPLEPKKKKTKTAGAVGTGSGKKTKNAKSPKSSGAEQKGEEKSNKSVTTAKKGSAQKVRDKTKVEPVKPAKGVKKPTKTQTRNGSKSTPKKVLKKAKKTDEELDEELEDEELEEDADVETPKKKRKTKRKPAKNKDASPVA